MTGISLQLSHTCVGSVEQLHVQKMQSGIDCAPMEENERMHVHDVRTALLLLAKTHNETAISSLAQPEHDLGSKPQQNQGPEASMLTGYLQYLVYCCQRIMPMHAT
jgi:hypothetical protein